MDGRHESEYRAMTVKAMQQGELNVYRGNGIVASFSYKLSERPGTNEIDSGDRITVVSREGNRREALLEVIGEHTMAKQEDKLRALLQNADMGTILAEHPLLRNRLAGLFVDRTGE